MAFRADYLARETGQNLVRNPLPTIAAITTVGVALTGGNVDADIFSQVLHPAP